MKIDRLFSIIMILLNKKRIGAYQLATMFEVSQRTIYRDVETINRAGIPIRSTSGVGGGFEIMPEYKLDAKVFSTADLSAILMGLSSLSTKVRGDEVVNTLAKDITVNTDQLSIDLRPWMGNRNLQPYLEVIKTALQQCKLLSFAYADRYGNRTI